MPACPIKKINAWYGGIILRMAAKAAWRFASRRTPEILVLLTLLLATMLLHAQYSTGGKVKGFRGGEFYPISEKVPPNRLKFFLTGAEAEPRTKDLIDMKEMRLENYAVDRRTNVIAKAPQCLVHMDGRQFLDVSSTGRLEMVTGNRQFFVEGNEGFFCNLTNSTLVVSNRGRTIIRHGPLNLPAR